LTQGTTHICNNFITTKKFAMACGKSLMLVLEIITNLIKWHFY
jgi:hypothetical protein